MDIKRKLFYLIPPKMRFAVRRLYYFPNDVIQMVSKPKELMPPKGIIYTGAGDFLKTGKHVVDMLVNKHGLKPNHTVLDMGSGIGRLAIPLVKVLQNKGMYRGFDVIQIGVNWCNKNITKRFPNFEFLYVPLHNDLYTKNGAKATHFQFPYPNNTFHFALANSLFTHMMPNEVKNYYQQLYAVMKLGAKVYATFFVVPSADKTRYNSNPNFSFTVDAVNYKLMDAKVTSANIAFDENYLLSEIIDPSQFKVVYQSYGYWFDESRTNNCEEYQDIIVVEKI
jgi:SAM-dependent methyltransferase